MVLERMVQGPLPPGIDPTTGRPYVEGELQARVMGPPVEKPPDLHGLFDRFAGLYRPRPTFVAVGVASILILRDNPQRKAVSFTNSSANWIWLSLADLAAVVGSGDGIAPNGTAVLKIDAWGYLYRGPIYGIATGAASNLGITEH